jgi:hypothetical protein
VSTCTSCEPTASVLPTLSYERNLIVVVAPTEIGPVYGVLSAVGSLPSVV